VSSRSGVLPALAAGALFGLGLAISRMVDPAKVLGFLDLAGDWDPSLALVLAGATGTALLGLQWLARRRPALRATLARLPRSGIDARLLGGACLFGIGWGLVGFCPGPALAALLLGGLEPAVFALAMAAGMLLADRLSG